MEDFNGEYQNGKSAKSVLLVDVRDKVQFDIVNIPGAVNMPLKQLLRDPTPIK